MIHAVLSPATAHRNETEPPMTKPPLTVHNAEIRTATVEIKTLTVSGKQVTLAVFRQLINDWLIDGDGNLHGVPWGIVNYCPDKTCASLGQDHRHVVWQDGVDLRRAVVHLEAWLRYGTFSPSIADRLIDCLVVDAIASRAALVGEGLPGIFRSHDKSFRWASEHFDGQVGGEASDAARKAWDDHVGETRRVARALEYNADLQVRQSQAASPDASPWPTPTIPALLRHSPMDTTYVEPASVQKLRELVGAFGSTTAELRAELVARERAEATRRNRLAQAVATVAALPQLFIAV